MAYQNSSLKRVMCVILVKLENKQESHSRKKGIFSTIRPSELIYVDLFGTVSPLRALERLVLKKTSYNQWKGRKSSI